MNQMIPQQPNRSMAQLIAALGPQSQLAGQAAVDPRALAAGIKASFAVMTFKGKTWGIRHRGNTTQLLARDPQGQVLGAIPTVDLVILKAAAAISKSFYIEKYKEGDFNQPDCWSTNGVTPDIGAPKIQNDNCKGCRWDAFGSRTMDDGRKGKACQDGKRLAVVPAGDLKNEAFGGPMLLRLPPSSFAALSELESQLHMQGYHYFAIVLRFGFDHSVAFPKIQMTPVRVLNDHEMTEVLEMQKSDAVDRILSEEVYEVSADPQQATSEASKVVSFKQPAAQQPAAQQPAPQTQPTAMATAFSASAPAPVIQPGTTMPAGFVVPAGQTIETDAARIARLEAELAAARGGASAAQPGASDASKPASRRGRRSNPVTPNGPQPTVVTQSAQGSPSGEQVPESEQPDDGGDTPPDLDSRIDALLKDAQ